MTQLIDWAGKVDDLSVSYEAGLLNNGQQILEYSTESDNLFPAIMYPVSQNPRDVVEADWAESAQTADSDHETESDQRADRTDYLIAVSCGTIAGLVDIFYAGELSIDRANSWGSEQTNKFVKKIAKLNGYKGDDLKGAISYMERHYPMASDSLTDDYGGTKQHHLRDFSHHFSLGGLMCSLFTQFTRKVIGSDTNGAILIEEVADTTLIGHSFEEKILYGTVQWFFHMVSDMDGSSSSPGGGTGIPGPLLSMMKEFSALPFVRDLKIHENEFHKWVSKLFNGTLLAKRDANGKNIDPVRFNLRTEVGLLHEVGRQTVPVVINECLVRSAYFLRRLYNVCTKEEVYSVLDLKKIDSSELLPVNNRVVLRMATVSSATFVAIDVADAAIRSAWKRKRFGAGTLVDFAVRINVAGVGRFIIACKEDGKFIAEDIREEKERRDQAANDYEKIISDLKCLALNYEQARVLYSLERVMINDDIALTKDVNARGIKLNWKSEWEKQIFSALQLADEAKKNFFVSERDVIGYFNDVDEGAAQYLIVMEALIFTPYYPIYRNELDKELKRVKYNDRYLERDFCRKQKRISAEDLKKLDAAYNKAIFQISGGAKNVVIGAAGTGVAIILTGGLASAFAPAIATTIAGGTVGFSGAALVSYSLATIGGGALAVGGLGAAGGTAIITGGGALLGLIGGTGVSAASTLYLLNENGYVLNECSRLLAFSRCILAGKYKDYESLENIALTVRQRIETIKKDLEKYNETGASDAKDERKKRKDRIKVAKKSLKYLMRCENELEKSFLPVKENANITTIPVSERDIEKPE